MKLQKIVNLLAKAYKALLHGKRVGGIDWPDQNNTIPGTTRIELPPDTKGLGKR